jgi:cell division cycle 2-like protein
VCALKKVKLEKERDGFPLTSVREINVLLSLAHPNIVNVSEVVVGSSLDSVFMVMEYADHDLKSVMERRLTQPFSTAEVKCLMRQLLAGTAYLHHNWVLHRDLKTSNILYTNAGQLKICDFGLARQYGSPLKPYTHLVVTLWYRAPELLLGEPSSLVTRRAVCVLCVSGHRKRAASTRAALFCVLFFSLAEGASAVWPARPQARAPTRRRWTFGRAGASWRSCCSRGRCLRARTSWRRSTRSSRPWARPRPTPGRVRVAPCSR